MQPFRMLCLAGALTAGVTAAAGYAYAGQSGGQMITFTAPPGMVTQIELSSSGPARISAVPVSAMPVVIAMPQMPVMPPMAMMPALPVPAAFFAPGDPAQNPLAQIERISAEMNQQAAAMMKALDTMPAAPGMGASFAMSPGGSASYTFISANSATPGTACMESVEILGQGPGNAPKVLSRRVGHCGPAADFGALPARMETPVAPKAQPMQVIPNPAAPAPHLIRVRDIQPVGLPHAAHT